MATKTAKGFAVRCPECNDEDAIVSIDLHDLTNCRCLGCDSEFSPKDALEKVREQMAKWEAVVHWVELAGECLAA